MGDKCPHTRGYGYRRYVYAPRKENQSSTNQKFPYCPRCGKVLKGEISTEEKLQRSFDRLISYCYEEGINPSKKSCGKIRDRINELNGSSFSSVSRLKTYYVTLVSKYLPEIPENLIIKSFRKSFKK